MSPSSIFSPKLGHWYNITIENRVNTTAFVSAIPNTNHPAVPVKTSGSNKEVYVYYLYLF